MSPLAEKIAALAATGLSMAKVAREIHYTRAAVAGLARRNKIHFLGDQHRKKDAPRVGERQPGVPAPVKKAVARAVGHLGGKCRWIEGDPHAKPVAWCDRPVSEPLSSWCAEHRRVVYDRRAAPIA